MSYTVSDLLTESLAIIGATAIDETVSVSDLKTCLTSANLMLDSWSAQRLMLRATIQETFPITAGVSSYTIGSGANFNTVKPIRVIGAYLRDSSNLDTPLDVIDKDLYDSYTDKVVSQGRPIAICYDAGVSQQSPQAGTIFVYYVPDDSYSLVLENQKYLTEFINLSDVVTFEPAYYEAIVYNVGVRIWPKFHRGKTLPPEIAGIARAAKRTVENMNARPICMGVDLPTSKKGAYNIYSDQ